MQVKFLHISFISYFSSRAITMLESDFYLIFLFVPHKCEGK